MSDIRFQLLGGLNISFNSESVTAVRRGRMLSLFIYLLLARGAPRTRKQIAFEFWPDSTEKQALTNLRKLLHDIRIHLPQLYGYLQITTGYLAWNPHISYYADIHEFELAAKGETLLELRRAQELYRGELTPVLYEEWLIPHRERLALTYAQVLDKLILLLESRGEFGPAIEEAKKRLALDPFNEENYRTLMRLHAASQNLSGAALAYRRLCAMLRMEFGGLLPSKATQRLYTSLFTTLGNPNASDGQYDFETLMERF